MNDATGVPLRKRDTPDLIVMFLALVIALVVLATIVGAIVWKSNDPDADLGDLTARVGDVVNTLIGAVVGYLAGRGVIPEAYSQFVGSARPPDTREQASTPPDEGEGV